MLTKQPTSIEKIFDNLEKGIATNLFNVPFFQLGDFRTDIKETEKEYIIESELPGFEKEDVSIEVKDEVLTISVIKDKTEENKNDNYIRRERIRNEMKRSFVLENIKEDEIKAELKNGLLKICIPKGEEKHNSSKKINID